MIKFLTEQDYEKHTPESNIEYFSEDSAIYIPDFDNSIEVEYSRDENIV